MRYIDFGLLELPQGWDVRAAKAQQDVSNAAGPAARRAAIDAHENVWKDLKAALGKISMQKCFYCETMQVRDDFEVDHFRPKQGTATDGHNGYWWLAFQPTNLYFSCRYCNQRRRGLHGDPGGGKGSAFPLGAGGIRATRPGENLDDEFPLLLDPGKQSDPPLIAFDQLGRVVPLSRKEDDPADFERACASIRLFHLNHGYLRRRREQKAILLKGKITTISLHLATAMRWRIRGNDAASQIAKQNAQVLMEELRAMKLQAEEYSSLTSNILKLSRSGRPWVEQLI